MIVMVHTMSSHYLLWEKLIRPPEDLFAYAVGARCQRQILE